MQRKPLILQPEVCLPSTHDLVTIHKPKGTETISSTCGNDGFADLNRVLDDER